MTKYQQMMLVVDDGVSIWLGDLRSSLGGVTDPCRADGGDSTATFVFNGDGQRVKSIMDGETTLFVGGHYEITNPGAGQTITKYYMAGASRVAIRKDGALSYMLADHLGSTSLVTDTNGNRTSELRYKPWGETRFSFGTMPTKYTFTGQFSYTDDPSTEVNERFGLMYYGARWYDNALSRFAQADTIIPAGTQAYDRYAYTSNNPVNYVDPSGHSEEDPPGDSNASCDYHKDPTNCPPPDSFYIDQFKSYGWTFEGSWSNADLKIVYQVALDIIAAVGGVSVMMKMFGAVTFDRNTSHSGEVTGPGRISLNPTSGKWTEFGVAHELGHIWDQKNKGDLSTGLQDYVGSSYKTKIGGLTLSYGSPGNGPALADGGWPSSGNDYLWNKGEDFANSFAGYIYPKRAETSFGVSDWRNTPRGLWIAALIPEPYSYPYGY